MAALRCWPHRISGCDQIPALSSVAVSPSPTKIPGWADCRGIRFFTAASRRAAKLRYILIEGKGESQHFALMVAKSEGLAQLVFLDEFIDEVNRAYAFHALSSKF